MFSSDFSPEIVLLIMSFLEPKEENTFSLVSRAAYLFVSIDRILRFEAFDADAQLKELCRLCTNISLSNLDFLSECYTTGLNKYISREDISVESRAIAMTILAIIYYRNPKLNTDGMEFFDNLDFIYKLISYSDTGLLVSLICQLSKVCSINILDECQSYISVIAGNTINSNIGIDIPLILNPYCAELIDEEFIARLIKDNIACIDGYLECGNFDVCISGNFNILYKMHPFYSDKQREMVCSSILTHLVSLFDQSAIKEKVLDGWSLNFKDLGGKLGELFFYLQAETLDVCWDQLLEILENHPQDIGAQLLISGILAGIVGKVDVEKSSVSLKLFLKNIEFNNEIIIEAYLVLVQDIISVLTSEVVSKFFRENKAIFNHLLKDFNDVMSIIDVSIFDLIAKVFQKFDDHLKISFINFAVRSLLNPVKTYNFLLHELGKIFISKDVAIFLGRLEFLNFERVRPYMSSLLEILESFSDLRIEVAKKVGSGLCYIAGQTNDLSDKVLAARIMLSLPDGSLDPQTIESASNCINDYYNNELVALPRNCTESELKSGHLPENNTYRVLEYLIEQRRPIKSQFIDGMDNSRLESLYKKLIAVDFSEYDDCKIKAHVDFIIYLKNKLEARATDVKHIFFNESFSLAGITANILSEVRLEKQDVMTDNKSTLWQPSGDKDHPEEMSKVESNNCNFSSK